MTSIDVPRNSSQKSTASIGINVRKILSPFIFYTCPVGKKAVIRGTALCDSTGAAATVDLRVAGISIAEWQAAGGVPNPNVPQDLELGTEFRFEVQLNAGETLLYDQNSGTNASINVNISIQESSTS